MTHCPRTEGPLLFFCRHNNKETESDRRRYTKFSVCLIAAEELLIELERLVTDSDATPDRELIPTMKNIPESIANYELGTLSCWSREACWTYESN